MNDGICMMLPNKDGSIIRFPHEAKNIVCFEGKEYYEMDNFLDMGLGNYVVLEGITNKESIDQIFDGPWKLFFDGAFSKNGSSIVAIIEIHDSKIHPHGYNLNALIMK